MVNVLTVSPKYLSRNSATLMVITSAVCFRLVPWFAMGLIEAGMASTSVAFFRFLVSAVVLFPLLAFTREKLRATLMAISSGMAMGLGWIGYVEALKVASVSSVSIIYMTYPLFTILISWVWFRGKLDYRSIIAGVIILFAAFISLSFKEVTSGAISALMLCFFAPLTVGFAITVLTTKLQKLVPLERTAGVSVGAAIGLLPIILGLNPEEVIPADVIGWMMIVGISVVTALVPNILYAVAAPFIGPVHTAMAGSFELPTMFVVGWVAFGEMIGLVKIFSGMLVIIAILITPSVNFAKVVPSTVK